MTMSFSKELLAYTSKIGPNEWLGISFLIFMLLLICGIALYRSESIRRSLINKTAVQDNEIQQLREQKAPRLDTP
jgi:ABC-type multidrug transport system permease subunit|tara:strand:+ start:426 stop:650 length:225 start_codon:yes stop_codon:yes gene_type:complete